MNADLSPLEYQNGTLKLLDQRKLPNEEIWIDYSDFRDVGGRKVPHIWVISQVRNREFTWAMQNVRAMAVEDSKFARPPAATAAR